MTANVFDTLMAGARAAAAAAETKQSPPKKTNKRKLSSSSTGGNKNNKAACYILAPKPSVKESKEITVVKNNEEKKEDENAMKLINFQTAGRIESNIMSMLKTDTEDFEPESMVPCWGDKNRVPFMFLCQIFDLISEKCSQKIINNIACNMLRIVMETTPDDLIPMVYLSANKIVETGSDSDLGVDESLIIKLLAETYGITENRVKDKKKTSGDLGKTAEHLRSCSSQYVMYKPQPLTVVKVFDTFQIIAKLTGKDSEKKKINSIKPIIIAAGGCQLKYIIWFLLQKSKRIGFGEPIILEALGHAAVYYKNPNPKSVDSCLKLKASEIVKRAVSICPVYSKLINVILNGGVWEIPKECGLTVGIPVKPMLSNPIKSISEMINMFFDGKEQICEYKYDGQRAQIHYMEENGKVEIFNRSLERSTEMYPDVLVAISRLKKMNVKSFVLDCEIVAYDCTKQEILPLEILSTRKRKVALNDVKVNVCIFAFDMLYLNGNSLCEEPLKVRKSNLYESFEEELGVFQFATGLITGNLNETESFFDSAINAGCEGLIIKDFDGLYEPNISFYWRKLKIDYIEGVRDSLDLVPIAAYYGKCEGVYGSFLMACYDRANGKYESICKLGIGFTEPKLKEIHSRFQSKVITEPKPDYLYDSVAVNPDVWFETSEVWEVNVRGFTISSDYCAAIGMVEHDKGLSARFPRFIREGDKDPDQATSSNQIAEMYKEQFAKSTQ
ncbi:DNA ligase, ATP-dependent [Corchorus olitorius]|uniref:DNA ligase n=1 Tax=Corchorus olitorius TaxID=93759 RepID=A0A1R3K8A2_9ROSI|nr:DNA ligase, ATP-dependent [Corchorus olitorius]